MKKKEFTTEYIRPESSVLTDISIEPLCLSTGSNEDFEEDTPYPVF